MQGLVVGEADDRQGTCVERDVNRRCRPSALGHQLLGLGGRTVPHGEYDEDAVLRVKQIRHLLGAGLSSEDIAYLLPCAVGEAPELLGCPELLAAMRSRLQRLDDRMDRLAQSRDALADYIDAAERMGNENNPAELARGVVESARDGDRVGPPQAQGAEPATGRLRSKLSVNPSPRA
ncbi:MerR family DNA-binding protein [Streptomyces sp. NPDC001858]